MIRAQANMNQEQFASALGTTAVSINRWENGSYNPSRLAKKAFEDFCEKRTINFSEENN